MKRRGALTVLGLGLLTCHQAILTAPDKSTMHLSVNPPFIPANGGVAVVSALVIEPAGTPVPDGTVVQFTTTLGRIDEQGKTNDGMARVNLVSDSRSGIAHVNAYSGSNTAGPEDVTIGTKLPARVFVTVDPTRLTDSRSTQVVATVYDDDGNPVPNIAVIFTVNAVEIPRPVPTPTPTPPVPAPTPTPPPLNTEYMESGGAPQYTDNSGRARDVMWTRYPRDATQKTATITATTSNGKKNDPSTIVTIN